MSGADVAYAKTVETPRGSAEVGVRLRDLYDLLGELEATGRQGVDLRGAVCAGVVESDEDDVRGLLGDGATDLDLARAVFGGDTRPAETPLAGTYLLACTPADAPEALVEEMFAR